MILHKDELLELIFLKLKKTEYKTLKKLYIECIDDISLRTALMTCIRVL